MAEVQEVKFGPRAPDGLADDLRALADAVDRGELVALVSAYVINDEYKLHFSASLETSLVLATLLQNACVERFKE